MTGDSTVAEIEASGGTSIGIEVDVRDHEAVQAMVARVVQEWGRVDVLVANAGGASWQSTCIALGARLSGRRTGLYRRRAQRGGFKRQSGRRRAPCLSSPGSTAPRQGRWPSPPPW